MSKIGRLMKTSVLIVMLFAAVTLQCIDSVYASDEEDDATLRERIQEYVLRDYEYLADEAREMMVEALFVEAKKEDMVDASHCFGFSKGSGGNEYYFGHDTYGNATIVTLTNNCVTRTIVVKACAIWQDELLTWQSDEILPWSRTEWAIPVKITQSFDGGLNYAPAELVKNACFVNETCVVPTCEE